VHKVGSGMNQERPWYPSANDAGSRAELERVIQSVLDEEKGPRVPGCECHMEEGDSPCPVHGTEEERNAPVFGLTE